ncbi:MAG: ABC transporter permease [Acidobacteriota bacterium]|nr:ABC transporter permease [Acidobacteriota bacterium]MDH3522025.1 ABC transporter permease [Acidobacteriota bacterium]
MIATVMRLAWTNLTRDRAALFLTFLVPLVFFSIFALIFGNLGGGGDGGPKALKVLVVDEDGTAISARFLATVAAQDGLEVTASAPGDDGGAGERWTRETALREVRRGGAAAAVVVRAGFGDSYGDFGATGAPLELIHDASNPLARYTVNGLLQAAAFQTSPGVLMERGLEALEDFGGGGLTQQQRVALGDVKSLISTVTAAGGGTGGGTGGAGSLVAAEVTAAHDEAGEGEEKKSPSMVAYYAAGIGVMFLLFSTVAAAGTLLEDQESGTLDRLLSSRLGMGELLRARWLFYSLLGALQVTLMFLWGALAFGLDLFTAKRLAGFALMVLVTGAAAAAFALLLATACKSRAQLGGVSTIVILVMSALGGSMVPRFVMPDFMDTLAKLTFNGWALDGFLKVFWYDDPAVGVAGGLVDLLPQVGVLAAAAAVFLWLARRLARRWETA